MKTVVQFAEAITPPREVVVTMSLEEARAFLIEVGPTKYCYELYTSISKSLCEKGL